VCPNAPHQLHGMLARNYSGQTGKAEPPRVSRRPGYVSASAFADLLMTSVFREGGAEGLWKWAHAVSIGMGLRPNACE